MTQLPPKMEMYGILSILSYAGWKGFWKEIKSLYPPPPQKKVAITTKVKMDTNCIY